MRSFFAGGYPSFGHFCSLHIRPHEHFLVCFKDFLVDVLILLGSGRKSLHFEPHEHFLVCFKDFLVDVLKCFKKGNGFIHFACEFS